MYLTFIPSSSSQSLILSHLTPYPILSKLTIDFVNYGFKKVDVRIPFHMTAKDLINELCKLYGLESKQRELEYQSFKAVISEQFVSGKARHYY